MKKLFSLFFVSLLTISAMAWDALYIVGGGTKQAGWDDERIPMVKISETEFEYSGYFYKTNIGEGGSGEGWKIVSSGTAGDWGCTQYRPVNDWAECARGAEVIVTDNGADHKFWVDASGFYTINIKTDVNKVTISNSDKPKYLIPVGDCCENGWNNRGNQRLTETSVGSGMYTGTLTLTPSNGHWMKFLCQPLFTVHVGPKSDNDGDHDISGIGVFDTKTYVDGDHKFYVLDQAAGTYNMTVDINDGKLYVVPQNITIKAQITKEAVAALGSVKCFAWTGIGSEAKDMSLVDGFYTATFSTHMPLSFLIYNGKFNNEDGGVQSVDMSNDGKGYYADKCVNLISRRTDNKLMCFHNDNCSLNTNSYTVNIYVEDAGWNDVYFYTQNAGDQNEYQNVFTHATKGTDNWYSYTFEQAASMTWVATATTQNWDTQVNDIDNVNEDKYFYVSKDKHDNGHHKVLALTGKDQMKDLTFEYKFDGAAHTSWGDENPVGLYYWQNYAFVGEEASDHAGTVQMSKGDNDIYTATVKAFNNIKFCVQSDLQNGYHGAGHWTVSGEQEETGYTENKKFWIRDNGSGHYVELTENFDFTPAEMHIMLNMDGFASLYWDKNYELTGADAYVGHVTDNTVVLTKIEGNGIIPAKSAVILYGTPNTEATATETLDASTGYDYSNAFRGSTTPLENMSNIYVLAQTGEPNSTAFYYLDSEHAMTIPAYRAYLPGTIGSGAPLRIRFATNTTTGLENANANVNVNKVLRNGRVYIVRENKVYTIMGQTVNE